MYWTGRDSLRGTVTEKEEIKRGETTKQHVNQTREQVRMAQIRERFADMFTARTVREKWD